MVGLLAGLGVLVIVEAGTISRGLGTLRTLGPRVVPYFVGRLLLVVAVLLAVDIMRGGRGEQESGEDIDLSHGTDWRTLGALVACVGGVGQLIPLIGFPAAGALMFFGCSRLLGCRRLGLDLLVSIVVPVVAFLLFTEVLGIYLPRQVSDGLNRLPDGRLRRGGAAREPDVGAVGVMLGTFVGVLPGIGPAMTLALLFPLTYSLEPASALILFAGIYYGGMYGGSTTSILLNAPGESSSVMTAIEGNKMAKPGRGAQALATAAIGSFVAGTIAPCC